MIHLMDISKNTSDDIASMFDSISPHYDFLNHLLSFNIDRPWRKKLVRSVKRIGAQNVLDLACGTGDISIALYRNGINVTGMDISDGMLSIAQQKCAKFQRDDNKSSLHFLHGSADDIPFPEGTFDAVTISFGIRNFSNRKQALQEILRVIKPNGHLCILEFSIPKHPVWKSIYTFYFQKVLPLVGRLVSRDKYAYTYLPASAFAFPSREVFCNEIEAAGFHNVSYKSMTGGVACLYICNK